MFKRKHKKAFTLIELIVVMAVIGILVLLSIPKFMGHTKEAKFTKLISDTKVLETASERYYMDYQNWPRLTDEPYTSEQIEAFAQKIYDTTGKEVILDSNGKYYDLDYSKLSKYVKIPNNKEQYIIQNPVGNVYALDNLTKEAQTRISSIKATGITLDITNLTLNVGEDKKLTATLQPENVTNKNIIWESSNTSVVTVNNGVVTAVSNGTATIKAYSWDKGVVVDCNITVLNLAPFSSITFTNAGATGRFGPTQAQLDVTYENTPLTDKVTSSNGIQLWTVPTTGTYRIETYGAEGGASGTRNFGGKGAIMKGDFYLTEGTQLKILVGQMGQTGKYGGSGGGGTFVAKSDNTPLIVSGGGGGMNTYQYYTHTNAIITNKGTGGGAGRTTAQGGGGGFIGNGWPSTNSGYSFVNGGAGGDLNYPGGFGGGGGANNMNNYGAGGGGYNGGDEWHGNDTTKITGGGSYNAGINQSNSIGNTGHGKVVISLVE